MKALSIDPYYAMMIMTGEKAIEVRTWSTDYRGDILICSTAKKYHGTIPGHALGVVKLVDVRPLKKTDCENALMQKAEYRKGLYAWVLDDNRIIEPIPTKGRLSLWNYPDDEKIRVLTDTELNELHNNDPEAPEEWYFKYWKPLMI